MTASSAPPHENTRRDPQRTRELAAIHTAKKQLGLGDEAYRDLLFAVAGKRSSADLDAGERARVVERFRELGFKRAEPRVKDRAGFVYHERPEHRLAAALWQNLHRLGETDDPSPAALDRFVQRQTGIAALKWVAPETMAQVTEALKSWLARAGFATPSRKAGRSGEAKLRPEARSASVKRLALLRLVKAQWARLEEAGALSFGAEKGAELTGEAKLRHEARVQQHRADALDAYFDRNVSPCKKGVDHPMTSAAELDALAVKLGSWLRAARKRAGAPGAG